MTASLPTLADIRELIDYDRNARQHSNEQISQLKDSIRQFGFVGVLAAAGPALKIGHGRKRAATEMWEDGEVIMGPGRREALPEWHLPTLDVTGLSEAELRALVIADNKLALNATWDEALLGDELRALLDMKFEMPVIGFDSTDLERLMNPPEPGQPGGGRELGQLSAEFLIPPFSVLNARDGWWQDRKRAWIALGIDSEVGRGENLLKMSDTMLEPDPVKRAAMQAERAKFEAKPGGGGTNYQSPNGRRSVDYRAKNAARALAEREGREFDEAAWVGDKPASRVDTKATGTQAWVQQKTEEGDIAGGMSGGQSGTSIFDPVLCELAYRWFSPDGGLILDPFAGGSVRGIVAAALGKRYVGVDLRAEQVEANEAQWPGVEAAIGAEGPLIAPEWHTGDSLKLVPELAIEADFVFSCPPYGDLEVYSDDPADISTLDQAAFDAAYAAIIAAAIAKLKPDRFACFVVGDYRDKKGLYANFVSKTIAAFEAAGARLYNEAILVTSVGSLPIRAAKQFRSTRKMGKTHQNILVFVKGDPRKAADACGVVDVSAALADIEPDDDADVGTPKGTPALKPAGGDQVKISSAMAPSTNSARPSCVG